VGGETEPGFYTDRRFAVLRIGTDTKSRGPARLWPKFRSARIAELGLGRLVHALLALPDAATTDLTVTSQALAPQFGLGESEAVDAADLAERARALPEIAAAKSADLVYRELPFAVPIDGKLATGRIDLAYRKDGEWTV